MRNFQDTFETRKQSLMSVFFNLQDCSFKKNKMESTKWTYCKERSFADN